MNFIALKTGRIPGGGNSGLPTRLQLMGWGENPSAKGMFIVNGSTVAHLPRNQAEKNFDRIALDFEHNSVPGNPNYQGEPVTVAAYGTPVVLAGQGLFLENIDWTEDGRKFVGGGHYSDLSPTIGINDAREVIFIHSAAACRQGALLGRTIELSASSFSDLFGKFAALSVEEEKVRITLGLSLESWHRFSDSPIHSALTAFRAERSDASAEETVRKALGISAEDWNRQNA